jgi:DNA-binding MarR family transcriptional regulator
LRKLDDSIGFYVSYTANSMRNALTKTFHDLGYDLTHAQWVVLIKLDEKEGKPMQELIDLLYKEKTTVTRMIDGLEKRGLIEKKPVSGDKRARQVFLTEDGIEIRKKLNPIALDFNEKISENLTDEEINQLISILKKIYFNVKKIY